MANEEHLAILRQGVQAWNQWRRDHPGIEPDLKAARCAASDFSDANFAGAILDGASLWGANLSRARLEGARLIVADLKRADLRGANLQGADLSNADLRGANLRGVQAKAAILRKAMLEDVGLSMVVLIDADLSGADLTGAHLFRAQLAGARFVATRLLRTDFGDIDLRQVVGLDQCEHMGPSSIGVDTILRSRGEIPESFLRGAGIPDEVIRYIPSLVGRAIEFYSCFISYSSSDQEFAERLHADLQVKGVRCWFAPEDLKIGDQFRNRIDEAIRVHDKLLLILSEHSVASDWVESEVEAALEKERRSNTQMLFPIRLDEAVMETSEAWAAEVRRKWHIGDFRGWKEHDRYRLGFERLMRDLKAERGDHDADR